MAAPPLPPRVIRSLLPDDASQCKESSTPPLLPRRWVGSSLSFESNSHNNNELQCIVPPPSKTTFKRESDGSDLINLDSLPFVRTTTTIRTQQVILQETKVSTTTTAAAATPRPWVYDRLPQSWSAPDLARLQKQGSSTPIDDIFFCMKKKNNSNLIDLFLHEENGTDHLSSSSTSNNDILRLFDPLTAPGNLDLEPQAESAVDATETTKVLPTALPNAHQQHKNKQQDEDTLPYVDKGPERQDPLRRLSTACGEEVLLFAKKLSQLRSEFRHDDNHTNCGLVISPVLERNRDESLSIKLIIDTDNGPTSFTCDVHTAVEHVISVVVCDRHPEAVSMDNFILKVHGMAEYLTAQTSLVEYEYVHQCHKFDRPVHLTLVELDKLDRPLVRTRRDDATDTNFDPEELLAAGIQADVDVTFKSVGILLDTLQAVTQRLLEQLGSSQEIHQPQGVSQAVRAICTHLGCVETTDISAAVQKVNVAILRLCKFRATRNDDDDNTEDGDFLRKVDDGLYDLRSCIYDIIRLYCRTNRVDFFVQDNDTPQGEVKEVTAFLDTILCKVEELHRLPFAWLSNYERFSVTCELRHGTRVLAVASNHKFATVTKNFFDRVILDNWLEFEDIPMCTLPRESRLCFLVHGTPVSSSQDGNTLPTMVAWTSLQLFDHAGHLAQGGFLLGLWPTKLDEPSLCNGPADCSGVNNLAPGCPVLRVQLPQVSSRVRFPDVSEFKEHMFLPRPFESLDAKIQDQLNRIVDGDPVGLLAEEEKELLWDKREYLQARAHALPKLLQASHAWHWACLAELYALVRQWTPMQPADALVLLLPEFPDIEIRRIAISWLKGIGSDELCDYLPQLVQVLRFEPWLDCPVLWFLLERSLTSIRVAHHLYWLLRQVDDPLAAPRCSLVAAALLRISGKSFREQVERQGALVHTLGESAERLKNTKESLRLATLFQDLERVHHTLRESPTCLPLSPALEVDGVRVKSCAYFTSNTLPLKIIFESGGVAAIFKVGDDLRQDMLTLQMIRIMDKLWLKEGLDLKIVTFGCVATGPRMGMVEMVEGAETLRKIQTELGLTGSFKDRPIAEWLKRHNPSEQEFDQSSQNFTLSCAGYCVATHVLGIGDRHNDNIMLKTSGHVFHIDFGKFLGDSQMFGNIKRDRAPFVLTSDMAYVINGGEKPTRRFQKFVELCCYAFNVLRRRSAVFLNLFALMLSSGIPGVTSETVGYVERALLPYLTEAEATAHFARMIEESLHSRFTQFNFFIHNLAQLRFTGDHNDGQLLSFTPKTYTKEGDGRIVLLKVVTCKKSYDTEKRYKYVVRVDREGSNQPSFVSRSYREFCELQQKLCVTFSLAKFHTLPKLTVGRSNVREVAERRRVELSAFLDSLLTMAEEIAHCPLVYTFFHPLMRDQGGPTSETEVTASPTTPPSGGGKAQGHVKLSIIFKNNSFFVMVMHAKNLRSRSSGKHPDPYVKIYLLPDPSKLTKRKTRIVYRNANPTFMEMMVYQLPLEVIRRRTLHVAAWDYDRVQENQFLGAAVVPLEELDLHKETTCWFQLQYLPFRPAS